MRVVAITGLGLTTALGRTVEETMSAYSRGEVGVRPTVGPMTALPIAGVAVVDVDVRPLLKRRKDRKLLPRAAHLGMFAAKEALGDTPPEGVGLFMGVGREPPDSQDVEKTIVASEREGVLDPVLLFERGMAFYPPLASLKTLPNLALAHISIQLGLNGPGGTRAGTEEAGLAAVFEAYWAVAEGRCDVALGGAADSLVDLASARDLVRTGRIPVDGVPGEGSAFLKLEPLLMAVERGARIYGVVESCSLGFDSDEMSGKPKQHSERVGWCGAASGTIELVNKIWHREVNCLDLVSQCGFSVSMSWRQHRFGD